MTRLAAIVGHRHLTGLLARAIARHTLPPTLLFSGPVGVGKYRVARAVAAVLNCQSPLRSPTPTLAMDACGQCRSCDRITRGVHVDLLTLEPDGRGLIDTDAVRSLLSQTGFRPFEGSRRVVVVREADTLITQAQNALLKSLEEPPSTTVFVLTTAQPDVLLATVRSRCMRIRFGRLLPAELAEVLTRDHDVAARDARDAAALSDGSVGQALALVTGADELAVIREKALTVLRQAAGNAAVAPRLRAGALLAMGSSKKEATRAELAVALRQMASLLRDVELVRSGGDEQALANATSAREIAALSRSYPGDRTRDAFLVVDRAIAALQRKAGIKVVSEWVATQI
ncbi:MAG: DNA polymerase III subunit [Acidobacteriota bacterium]